METSRMINDEKDDMSRISLRVPLPRRDYRWWYYRIRGIVRAQFQRSTWAKRCYRLAVKIDGRPARYIAVRSNHLCMVIPQQRFGPGVHHIQALSPDGGQIIGNLTREQLTPEDTPDYVFGHGPYASGWGFESLIAGLIRE